MGVRGWTPGRSRHTPGGHLSMMSIASILISGVEKGLEGIAFMGQSSGSGLSCPPSTLSS